MTISTNLYDLLGVPQSADGITIRKAYCSLSKALHPDTTQLPKDEAAKKFQEVCDAYELLADPNLRRAYDATLIKSKDIDDLTVLN